MRIYRQLDKLSLFLPAKLQYLYYNSLNLSKILYQTAMKDFLTLCKERFSARKFSNETVKDEDLNYILECVRLAPSAVNRQPWKFLVVRSKENMEKLQQCYDRDWFRTAPICIIALKNTDEAWVRPYDQKNHGDIDLAIAIEHLCIAATERGLGSCWICNYDTNKFSELFTLPQGTEPVALIPIGYIADDCPRKDKSRKDKSEIIATI